MKTLIVIFSVVIVIHFVYEAIILPSIQNYLRFKVDALKDKLIFSTVSSENRIKPLEFNFIMKSLEINYSHIDEIAIPLLIKSHFDHKKNADITTNYDSLRHEVTKNEASLEQLEFYENKCSRYMFAAFIANSFMYFIYLFPILITLLLFVLMFYSTKSIKNHIVKDLKTGADITFTSTNTHAGYCYH